MKKLVDFLGKKIEPLKRYKEFKIVLNLEKDLDMNYSKFSQKLSKDIKRQLDEQYFTHYVGDVVLRIYTKLPREELIPLKNLIFSTVVENFIKTKEEYKTEKILGLLTFKEFEKIEVPLITLMDLINYPLHYERFNVGLYDKDNLLYKSLVDW